MQPSNELSRSLELLREKRRRSQARRSLTDWAVRRGFKPAPHHRLTATSITQRPGDPLVRRHTLRSQLFDLPSLSANNPKQTLLPVVSAKMNSDSQGHNVGSHLWPTQVQAQSVGQGNEP